MTKRNEKAITRAALAELQRLSLLLDTDLEETANMSIEEIESDLRAMGLDPNRPLSAKIRHLLFEEARGLQAPDDLLGAARGSSGEDPSRVRGRGPFHVYISDDPLGNEDTGDEVKLLIQEIRYLARRHRYEEALERAHEAIRLDPDYWRSRVTLATLSVLFGKVGEGDKIFQQVTKDFPHNDKAVAAGLHGCAWIKEIRYALNPSANFLREATGLYGRSLQLDDSRTNTRVCLLIRMLVSEEEDNEQRLLEESLLSEGFFEHMDLELRERPAREHHKALPGLPAWLRRFLFPIGPVRADGYGY